MLEKEQTLVTPLQIRQRDLPLRQHDIEWNEVPKRSRGESFAKNLAMSAALVLCAITLRAGAVPSLTEPADVILTAATDQSLLDDQLGKLSFVSALFPEAVLVFGEQEHSVLTLAISSEAVVHTWSEQEPYTAWHAVGGLVFSPCDGEVIGVYHGNGDERLVQIMSADGIACLYGNLKDVHVATGDYVTTGTTLGMLQPDEACILEVRENGRSVDPARYMPF